MSDRPGYPSFDPPAGSTPPQRPDGPPQGQPPQTHAAGPSTAGRPPKRGGAGTIVAVALAASLIGGGVGSVATLAATQNDRGTQVTQTGNTTPVIEGSGTAVDWAAVAKAVEPAVVSISVTSGQSGSEGSGVVLDPQGHIATNNHVISGGQNGQINVTLNDNTIHRASIVGTDPGADLAVIRIDDPPSGLTPIAFGDVSGLAVGDPVMAIGNPLGLSGSVTTGIISALHRPVRSSASAPEPSSPFNLGQNESADTTVVTDAIQTSAAINPGNSGGALVNANGQLIGLTSSIATLGGSGEQSGNIGIGFAIRADQVQYITGSLIETGKSVTPVLGVSTTDGIAQVQGQSVVGAQVREVVSGSPADEAGGRVGDVVTAVDGVPITGSLGLAARIRSQRVGDVITLDVNRNGSTEQLKATLAGR